jgi:hypothetical protein
MKKIVSVVVLLGVSSVVQAKKMTHESRTHLRESIACAAGDILEQTPRVLTSCAQRMREESSSCAASATCIEQVADVQTLMIKIVRDIVDDDDVCWAAASRPTLQQMRDTLNEIKQQMSHKNRDEAWWRTVCSRVTAVMPSLQKT